MFLSDKIKITKVKDHSTADTTAVNSDGVDMSNYRGCLFVTSFGTAAANNTCNIAQGADNSADWVDLEGSAVGLGGASDEDIWLDVYDPIDRYVRLEAARGTSSTLESIWAIQYDPRTVPVDNTTTGTIAGEALNRPAEGTA